MQPGLANGATHLGCIPNCVLENVLLNLLSAEELCKLGVVSRRFAGLTRCEMLWGELYEARWGPPTALMRRAAKLAGGWPRFYAEKACSERASAPWTKPSPSELKASLEKLSAGNPGNKEVAVVFCLDGSGSVNEEEFATMTGFVESAATALAQSAQNAKVAVIQFSNDSRTEYDLAPIDEEALRKATREMVRMNGGTNVAVAVQKAGQLLKRNAAVDAIRHVVLLTDGRVDTYQAHEARQMADRLADEQRNVTLHAYGVGRGVDKPELLHIIGGPPTCLIGSSAGGGAAATSARPAAADGSSATAAAAAPAVAATAAGAYASLSMQGEDAADRYLDLCTREESPW